MKRFLCLVGLHNWLLNSVEVNINTIRVCRRCNRREKAGYDMTYGETTWSKISN